MSEAHGGSTSEAPSVKKPGAGAGRLYSLDVYRGLVMTLLVAEGAGVYVALHGLDVSWAKPVAEQFMHPPWEGLRFWDLVQPAFMFIVGVAMVFSMRKRTERGDSRGRRFGHILKRCVILFLLGTGLHCMYADALVFELWNVLTQLSVTILIAFVIMELPFAVQLLISLALIGATDAAYRFILIAPYDQVFGPGANFGSYVDMLLMGGLNSDHWVAVNFIPSAAHTIWGVLAGRVLIGSGRGGRSGGAGRKALIIALCGIAGIAAGYGLEALGYAPIIKRICTGPFVLVSGGWCLLALAVFYGLIDGLRIRFGGWVVAVVGTNSILIYMITESMAYSWLNPKVGVFVEGWLGLLGVSEPIAALVNALVVWVLLWLLCVWLYRRKVFVKI
jgi:predicted acyltransferase